MINRPGLMMRGKVIMAPGNADATNERSPGSAIMAVRFIRGSRVYINKVFEPDVVSYDMRARCALVQKIKANGDPMPLQLVTGQIDAVPRF